MEFYVTVFITEGDSTGFNMKSDDVHTVFVNTLPKGIAGVRWLHSTVFVEIIMQGTKEGKNL